MWGRIAKTAKWAFGEFGTALAAAGVERKIFGSPGETGGGSATNYVSGVMGEHHTMRAEEEKKARIARIEVEEIISKMFPALAKMLDSNEIWERDLMMAVHDKFDMGASNSAPATAPAKGRGPTPATIQKQAEAKVQAAKERTDKIVAYLQGFDETAIKDPKEFAGRMGRLHKDTTLESIGKSAKKVWDKRAGYVGEAKVVLDEIDARVSPKLDEVNANLRRAGWQRERR
ncbi:MAG TPA: hypothetical protein VI953_03010 [Candidatus Paceibacterota bacterium]